eukprot:4786396-Karenia_brevis.AAC.1
MSESGRKEKLEEKSKVILDEKHFRRMDKFGGGETQFGRWIFHVGVALGQVDSNLADEISRLIRRESRRKFPDDWDPKEDMEVDQ